LARQPYTPWAWRLYFWLRVLGFFAAYTTIVDQRALRFKLMKQGVWDSVRGRLGRVPLE
jgi:rhamnosyltransferase